MGEDDDRGRRVPLLEIVGEPEELFGAGIAHAVAILVGHFESPSSAGRRSKWRLVSRPRYSQFAGKILRLRSSRRREAMIRPDRPRPGGGDFPTLGREKA